MHMLKGNKSNFNKGFTLVEMAIVVGVIGILASAVLMNYNGWQRSINISELRNDLIGASASMESYRTFHDTYPGSVPYNFKVSNSNNMTIYSVEGSNLYCINSESTIYPDIKYYILKNSTEGNPEVKTGRCEDVLPEST